MKKSRQYDHLAKTWKSEYRSGKILATIAREYNVSLATVWRYINGVNQGKAFK